eukprot:XP_020397158.1 rRNA 2'-O-methyltransferase fibrillarin-like [Zea mays]
MPGAMDRGGRATPRRGGRCTGRGRMGRGGELGRGRGRTATAAPRTGHEGGRAGGGGRMLGPGAGAGEGRTWTRRGWRGRATPRPKQGPRGHAMVAPWPAGPRPGRGGGGRLGPVGRGGAGATAALRPRQAERRHAGMEGGEG